jgi:hypothetical protein
MTLALKSAATAGYRLYKERCPPERRDACKYNSQTPHSNENCGATGTYLRFCSKFTIAIQDNSDKSPQLSKNVETFHTFTALTLTNPDLFDYQRIGLIFFRMIVHRPGSGVHHPVLAGVCPINVQAGS